MLGKGDSSEIDGLSSQAQSLLLRSKIRAQRKYKFAAYKLL